MFGLVILTEWKTYGHNLDASLRVGTSRSFSHHVISDQTEIYPFDGRTEKLFERQFNDQPACAHLYLSTWPVEFLR